MVLNPKKNISGQELRIPVGVLTHVLVLPLYHNKRWKVATSS
jgi:hypothetical protein